MLKVLVDGEIYKSQGGISRCFTELMMHMGTACDDIKFILHLPGECNAIIPRANWISGIKDLSSWPFANFKGVAKQASKARARLMHPRIFHSTYYTLPYWSGLKQVVTVHDFIYEKFPALLENAKALIERKRTVIENADALVAVSFKTKEDILRYTEVEESKITVIHHGVSDVFCHKPTSQSDTQEFMENYDIESPYWLYVGKRGLYKNFNMLLKAFVRISSQVKGHLVTVGGEPSLDAWQTELLIRHRERVHRQRRQGGI